MSNNTLEIFALTEEQTALMYSFQRQKVLNDIENEKNINSKNLKTQWLNEWTQGIKDAYYNISSNKNLTFSENLKYDFNSEISNSINKTWYYLVVLETEFFCPYFPLNENDKKYKHIKYKSSNFVYNEVLKHDIIEPSFVIRLIKSYRKTLHKLNGTVNKIIVSGAITVAATALSFGLAAAFAGPIAVTLVGSNFAGLSGAALTNACLAYIGGGAIAVGGAGMAGGTMIIAGGGALLGLAGSSSISGIATAVALNPKLSICSVAKLEVVIKEIILNTQHDIISAQKTLGKYKEKIRSLEDVIEKLSEENEKNKHDIANIKKTLEYFQKSYEELKKFTSSFEIGMGIENGKTTN